MINRRIIRTKVLQILFSFYHSTNNSITDAEKELDFSFTKLNDLYYYIFLLLIDIFDLSNRKLAQAKNKRVKNQEDINPNTKFINNKVIVQLKENAQLDKYLSINKLSWVNHPELLKKLLTEITESKKYADYMQDSDTSYKKDKDLLMFIIEDIIYNCELFYQILEEQSLFWSDNIEYIIDMAAKTLKTYTIGDDQNKAFQYKFKNSIDRIFSSDLLRKTIINKVEYQEIIDESIENWDLDRLASIDLLILQIAITELLNFEEIPIKVTLNEYIELAKIYSTKKSSNFINGILDKIVQKLKKENKIIKTGRGLK